MMLKECPCRYCDKRNSECHGSCLDYLTWKKENDELKNISREKQFSERLVNEDAAIRSIKKKKRKGIR